ncbi:uncharacterized protein LOC122643579 [Telopea speciosissima]|uniref:uncharacterized protein LOC122643579 n=1 Tax=Telopea speciosissima TaxID=54955 RepID=UPI001CC728EF|nr:uncharacterized protein LOC122643579 [Telopea speciosissima]
MGNCLRHESDIVWGGDNWGSADDWGLPESEKLYRKDTQRIPSSSADAETEVMKIKITKKEFDELAGKGDVEEMLTQLMNVGEERYQQAHQQQRSWRPALKSIPE